MPRPEFSGRMLGRELIMYRVNVGWHLRSIVGAARVEVRL